MSILIKNKKAFTLAEVLITLGIIGVVAAITIPAVINSTNRKQHHAAFKKAYSSLSQAVALMQNDYDSATNCNTNDSNCLGNLFAKYMKFILIKSGTADTIKECWDSKLTVPNPSEQKFCATGTDGIRYLFDMEYGSAISPQITAVITVDVNGSKAPNKFGNDTYILFIDDQGNIKPHPPAGNSLESYQDKCDEDEYYNHNIGCTSKVLLNIH